MSDLSGMVIPASAVVILTLAGLGPVRGPASIFVALLVLATTVTMLVWLIWKPALMPLSPGTAQAIELALVCLLLLATVRLFRKLRREKML